MQETALEPRVCISIIIRTQRLLIYGGACKNLDHIILFNNKIYYYYLFWKGRVQK